MPSESKMLGKVVTFTQQLVQLIPVIFNIRKYTDLFGDGVREIDVIVRELRAVEGLQSILLALR